ncbi:YciI family protein [Oleomonas cavernae]|uniref:YciI family protein n=1 Tax=Oleomonas cavernae TaxID=2320859 RepID=A0A418WHC1_9PROT|nr:YciI family protein [Oleomonas cavernae]RJF89436.1 YciI family protein [Oleomonas cavernae]
MLFAVICTDKPDGMPIRLANRPAHLDWLKAAGARIKLAGPFLTQDGQAMTGSLLVIEADSEPAVRELAAQDPYAVAGLFTRVEFKPWRWVIGAPSEG